jgi:hypothetical protein
MEKERDNSFFRLEFSSIVSLICLFSVFAVAHLPGVLSVKMYGLTMQSWLLSLITLFIPIWNIFAAKDETPAS